MKITDKQVEELGDLFYSISDKKGHHALTPELCDDLIGEVEKILSNSSGCSVEPMVICQFYNAKIPDLICATEVVIKINDDRFRNLVKKYLNDDITISDLQNKVKDIALDTLTISDIEIDI